MRIHLPVGFVADHQPVQLVIDNEVGKQKGYVAWFNIGYLRWKQKPEDNEDQAKVDLAHAEEAFFQAQRLSGIMRDEPWHTRSLRHMAEMQREQGNVEDAYQTVHRALVISREYESLLCAARYANKIGRTDEAVKLLDECIEMRPETIITMFAEEDFKE